MSQRKEKYARNVGRRIGNLEHRMDELEESRDRSERRLGAYGQRVTKLDALTGRQANFFEKVEERLRGVERGAAAALLLEVLLAAVILIVAINV